MRALRTRRRLSLLVALPAVGTLVVGGLAPADAAQTVQQRTTRLFVVHDRRIDEDSALVTWKGRFVTTNDSGDAGRLFVIGRDGRTVGVTHWMKHPVDCEALAPGDSPNTVWVGDIGDNDSVRSFIRIAEVPLGRGSRTVNVPKYRLVYPDGPHNAETLVRNPVTGRLYIATKDRSASGGMLYAVPQHLQPHQDNLLTKVAPVLPTATDGSFFPGGNYLVVRNYVRAAVYQWPGMSLVGYFRLPGQAQGEGLTAVSAGRVDLSSEAVRQPVLRLRVPGWVRRTVRTGAGAEAPTGPR